MLQPTWWEPLRVAVAARAAQSGLLSRRNTPFFAIQYNLPWTGPLGPPILRAAVAGLVPGAGSGRQVTQPRANSQGRSTHNLQRSDHRSPRIGAFCTCASRCLHKHHGSGCS